VYELVRTLRGVVGCDIETHVSLSRHRLFISISELTSSSQFHNDTMCAVANAHAALEAGATRTCYVLRILLFPVTNLLTSALVDVDTSVLGT
jgi:hypothetical protein